MQGFPLHRLLDGAAEYRAEATAPARLLDLGPYPAAVPDPAATVRGELYRVLRPALWTALDSAEGPQYDRGRVEVRLTGGRQVTAFIYWYVGPLDRGIPIPGGDYRAHAPARSVHRSVRAQEAMAWRLTRPS
jgi:gamma-glutamylcyclotransferase (GGCT)/AIG2-like uncharacterized protein YtfP